MPYIPPPLPQPLATTDSPTFAALVTPKIYPPSDTTTALKILKADGVTTLATIDTINSYVGIGPYAPGGSFHALNPAGASCLIGAGAGSAIYMDSSSFIFRTIAQVEQGRFSTAGLVIATTTVSNSPGTGSIVNPGGLGNGKKIIAGEAIRPGLFTVATAPAGNNGEGLFFTDGRKIGEGAGAGTGTKAVYSDGQWRRPSDETVIAA